MNDKERIEDIKEQLVMNAKLKIEDVNWLIHQAEQNQRYKQALESLRKHAMTYSPEREDDGSIIEDHTMRFIYEETTQALGIGMNNKEWNE